MLLVDMLTWEKRELEKIPLTILKRIKWELENKGQS
jgi:hypothetical protein